MEARFAVLADLIVAIHFCYVAFTVGGELLILTGGLLRWDWVRRLSFRITHLASVVLVAVEASTGTQCPLTVWEYQLRTLAGQRVEAQISFVARLVRSVIFYNFPGMGLPGCVCGICPLGGPHALPATAAQEPSEKNSTGKAQVVRAWVPGSFQFDPVDFFGREAESERSSRPGPLLHDSSPQGMAEADSTIDTACRVIPSRQRPLRVASLDRRLALWWGQPLQHELSYLHRHLLHFCDDAIELLAGRDPAFQQLGLFG